MNTPDATLQAIVSIRNTVIALSSDWKDIVANGKKIDSFLGDADAAFLNHTPAVHHDHWISLRGRVQDNTRLLQEAMSNAISLLQQRNAATLQSTWQRTETLTATLTALLADLQQLGTTTLQEHERPTWTSLWTRIHRHFQLNLDIAAGTSTQLAIIEAFAPEEVDELNDTILRHMPKHYSMAEALQYKAEYLQAYQELQAEAQQKKNLWDRFLDVLAGGAQQTPAERVMLQRWTDGDKGDL